MPETPFKSVYDTLWQCVLDHPQFTPVVKATNQIKFDMRKPYLDTVQSADLPELALTSEGGSYRLRSSSSSTAVTRRFDWVLTTGDMRLDEYLFPLSWVLLEALVTAQLKLRELTWHNQKYVTACNTLDPRDGESQAQRRSNIRGWSSVQTIVVEMQFSTKQLIAGATPNV